MPNLRKLVQETIFWRVSGSWVQWHLLLCDQDGGQNKEQKERLDKGDITCNNWSWGATIDATIGRKSSASGASKSSVLQAG